MSTTVIPDPVVDVDPALAEAQAQVDAAEAARVAAATPVVDEKKAPDTPSVPPVVTYALQLPSEYSTLDVGLVDRTTAIARELGLTPEAGQTVLNTVAKEIAARDVAQAEAIKPGGALWTERDTAWKAASLADPVIGGSPEQLALSVEKASQALAKYGSPELVTFLKETGLGSHPAALKLLANIGKAMSEPTSFVMGGQGSDKPATLAEKLYGKDGMGAKKTVTTP